MLTRSFDYALAAASGVLLALSFPKFGHPAFAWVALSPLLVALSERGSLWRAFGLGVTTGIIYFAGTVYWLTHVMVLYGGLPSWVAVPVNALFVAYLALFPALFAVIVRRFVIAAAPMALMVSPLVWVATELGRTHLFTGFPWVLLGYSQATVLPVAQLASVLGVYGVSALVAMVGAALASLVVASARGQAWRRGRSAVGVTAVVVAVVGVWGSIRAGRAEWTRAGQAVRVGLIQGNVDQAEKWDAARAEVIFQNYARMTRQALDQAAELVVWPESSTPFMFEEDRPRADLVRQIARQARVPILLGSDQIERGSPNKYYNAAFLLRADGKLGGVYRKMHLVPFGEYVPRPFFYAGRVVEAVSDFSPGEAATLLPVGEHAVSVAVCYEIIYPALVRQFVRGGSELLTTITNDAWFGRTSAPYQHFAQASMRAIENGRYLVRSANTGISGIVDPYGRIVAQTDIFQPAVTVGEARFLTASTFYERHGDMFAYGSVVTTIAMLAMARQQKRAM